MTSELLFAPIDTVTFQPWIGQRYKSRTPKLLVLGMSHYQWEEEKKTPDCLITRAVIEHWSERPKKFFTNIAATCIGHLPTRAERASFWDSVAFYNYIQKFAGNSPRQPHSYRLFKSSHSAFAEVLGRLKPQLILVLGILNWENIADLDGRYGKKLSLGMRIRGSIPLDAAKPLLLFT